MLIAMSILAWLLVGLGVAVVFGLAAQLNRRPAARVQESAPAPGDPLLARRPSRRRRRRIGARASRFSLLRSR
jgi:hypothetical protein